MSRNLTNMNNTNVYVNTNLSANAPLQVNQTSFNNPITVSIKGLNGYGTSGQIMKMNSLGNQLEWADDNNTEYTAGNQLNLVGTQFNLDTDIQIDSLGVGTYFDVGYSNPYTAIFNGNNYSISNPYLRWHFNGTDLQFNIPAGSGSSSNFRWLLTNTTELMKLDGNGLLTTNKIQLDGGSNEITDGTTNLSIGSTSGTIAVIDDIPFSISGSTMTADPDGDGTNVCTQFTISSGSGSNGDCILLIQADTDDTVETSNPEIRLRGDNAASGTNLKQDNNDFVIETTLSGQNIILNPAGTYVDIQSNLKAGSTTDNGQIEIQHGGAASEIGKLIFSNGTNSNTYSFEYSENTENFSFKKTNSTIWDYDSSNSPAKFTMYALFKFNDTKFHNSTNQQINLPTSAGTLALLSDITAARYWSLVNNDLFPNSSSNNLLVGTQNAHSSAPKLDVNGNSRLNGNLWTTGTLQVENYYAVNHSTPYTYIYDPTGYSTSNPFMRYHTNGTDLTFNLPNSQGASSSFRFLAGNSAELMRMDAAGTLKIFGSSSGKLEIENDGLTNSTSTLDFTNSDNGDFYRFEYNYSDDAFVFIHNHLGTDADAIWEYNDSTEEFLINKDTIVRNVENIDAKLFIECSEATGAEAKLIFGDAYVTDKYTLQYDYHVSTPAFELLDQNLDEIFRYTDNDDTFSFNDKVITTSRYISLTGIAGQITDGSSFFTLPAASGTLALESSIASLFTTSGTTMTADPQGDNSEVCTQFTISSGSGSNGDCVLLIQADTSNTVEESNPRIKLSQDGGQVYSHVEMTSNNDLRLETFYSGSKIILNPVSGANCEINSSLTKCSGDLECASSQFRVSYSSSYTRLFNPNSYPANTNAASHMYFHDNGTSLSLNVPNTSYTTSNSNNITFASSGSSRVRVNGSSNPSMQFYKTNGTTIYGNIGYAATFASNMGQWGGVGTPQGFGSSREVFYMGGEDDYDAEGCWSAMNGQSHGISNPGDNYTLWWYDEDDLGSTYWRISTTGVISSSSDSRVKTNVNTYKNSDFEKYKQIRTVTYNKKVPETINPERLNKQSCIDKYNQLHYGVIAQELYELYPELEDTKDRDKWEYRRDNWDTLYEEEHNKWLDAKEKYECCDQKDCDEVCSYKEPEPQKEFNEVEPIRTVEYNKLSLLTIGVVQDVIKENETLKQEVNTLKQELQNIKNILQNNNIS